MEPVQFGLDWDSDLGFFLHHFHRISFFLVFRLYAFILLDVETIFELVFNQILSLREVTNKLLTFLPSQPTDLRLLHYSSQLELFFLHLQLMLSFDELITQDFLFKVQIDEHLQVLFNLISLLFFYDLLDLSVLCHFLS